MIDEHLFLFHPLHFSSAEQPWHAAFTNGKIRFKSTIRDCFKISSAEAFISWVFWARIWCKQRELRNSSSWVSKVQVTAWCFWWCRRCFRWQVGKPSGPVTQSQRPSRGSLEAASGPFMTTEEQPLKWRLNDVLKWFLEHDAGLHSHWNSNQERLWNRRHADEIAAPLNNKSHDDKREALILTLAICWGARHRLVVLPVLRCCATWQDRRLLPHQSIIKGGGLHNHLIRPGVESADAEPQRSSVRGWSLCFSSVHTCVH